MSLIGKSVGNYKITAKIGEGGMGAVYLGEHPLIGKRVAVKVLLEELAANEQIVSRFFNEAKAVNDIGHQNIVDIVDFGKMSAGHGDIVYFVMEFLDGESLAHRVKKSGLSIRETLHVMGQCCSALAASHAKRIVHRDLKPENIYLCPRGTDKNFVKILDFGIAKLTGDTGQSMKTRTGLVIGTPTYMSPEQCEGKGQIDHRSDVYSLGVVMYELLTGRVPFPGDGFGEILVAHLTKTPENPASLNPDIPPEIEAICLHAIEKDKNRRFQNMEEMAAAVENPAAHLQAYRPGTGRTQAPAPAGGSPRTQQLSPVADGGFGSEQPTMIGQTQQGLAARAPVQQAGGQRITTLSGASGEVSATQGGRSKAPLFAVLGLLVLGGGGAAFYFTQRTGDKSVAAARPAAEAPKSEPAVAAPAKDEFVTVSITSDPTGAEVKRADQHGAVAGTTPLDLRLKKGSPSFDIQVVLEGYKPQTRAVSTAQDKEEVVSLVKIEAPPPAKPEVAAAPPVAAPKPKAAAAPPPPPPAAAPAPKPVAAAAAPAAPKKSHSSSHAPKKSGPSETGTGDFNIMKPSF
jgi:serine/threonine-protein kinase